MANRLFVMTGDYSGDMHAANVVKALRNLAPDIELAAVGGENLKALGVELLADQSRMGRVGLGGVLGAPYHWWLGERILKYVETFKPDAVLLIDYGGFNLYMAARLKKRGVRVFYFIPPQVWATRKGRIRKIKANVDHVFCIFPFEQPIYEAYGIPVTYVGHPLVGQLPFAPERAAFCQTHGLDPARPIVALMPGSRKQEIDYLLPDIFGSLPLIHHHAPDAQFVLAQAGSLPDDFFRTRLQKALKNAGSELMPPVHIAKNCNHALLGVADVMIGASGTVTLEAALYDTPMVIVYRLQSLVYAIAMRLLTLPYIGLPNILGGEAQAFVPELLQDAINPRAIAKAVLPLLDNASPQTLKQRNGFERIRQELNKGGAPENVARGILDLLQPKA